MHSGSETMAAARILASIAVELEQTRREIGNQLAELDGAALPRFDELTRRCIHHLFTVRGKYLRPSLVLLSALATDSHAARRNSVLPKVAAALELIHSASLIHDDVIDDADTRRREPSLNHLEGNKIAVLTGDLLYDQAFALLTTLTDLGHRRQLELFSLFTATTRKMCLGEIYEEKVEAAPHEVSFQDYMKVIDYKTGSLMASCCTASAIVMDAPPELKTRSEEYGYHLGVSYQLIDDVIDRDSVFYDPELMLATAVEEAHLAVDSLAAFGKSTYRDRLKELPDLLLRRAERTAEERAAAELPPVSVRSPR